MNKYPDLTEILKSALSEKRLRHSYAVAKETERLARRYGAEPRRAYFAGLSHDICKNYTKTESLQLFQKFGIILDSIEKKEKKLWHAIAGEVYLKNILGITDGELLRAVRIHTTGAAGMTLLQKILYIADYTSADREYPDVEEIRARAEISLDEAARYALKYTILDLSSREKAIHPDTLNAYNEFILKQEGIN